MTEATHVLVVEDDPDVRALLVAALEEDGCIVTAANDGTSALAVAPVGIDVVLLDLVLPDLAAAAFVGRFRSAGGTAPVVLTTAGCDAAAITACGAVSLVAKPFQIDALLAAVHGAHSGNGHGPETFKRKGDQE